MQAMHHLSKDNLIVPAGLAALIVVMTLAVYLPQRAALAELQSGITQRQESLKTDAAKVAMVPEMLNRVEEMKKRYVDFDQRLPRRVELAEFLHQISLNISQTSLSQTAIEPGNPVRENLFHTLPIIISFRGSYTSFVELLNRIEQMKRLSRVQKLKIHRQEGDDLKIEMSMNIYFTES